MKDLTGKSKDFESQVSGSLTQLKTDLKELLTKGVKSSDVSSTSIVSGAGLSEADRTFLKELSNDTRDAIQDMRLEVLTASDKSKLKTLLNLFPNLKHKPSRFRKNCNSHQGIPRSC